MQLNPSEEVPTLCIDGHVLNQSVSIIEYLEKRAAGATLLRRISLRAKVRRYVISSLVVFNLFRIFVC